MDSEALVKKPYAHNWDYSTLLVAYLCTQPIILGYCFIYGYICICRTSFTFTVSNERGAGGSHTHTHTLAHTQVSSLKLLMTAVLTGSKQPIFNHLKNIFFLF